MAEDETENDSLETLARLRADGYVHHLHALPGGRVRCAACGGSSPAAKVGMERIARFEGTSDPASEQVVAGVVCPSCDAKAILVLSYGPEASLEDATVLAALDDQRTHRPTVP